MLTLSHSSLDSETDEAVTCSAQVQDTGTNSCFAGVLPSVVRLYPVSWMECDRNEQSTNSDNNNNDNNNMPN